MPSIPGSTTKITFNVQKSLLASFDNWIDECHLKRDAFLERVISSELAHLDSELKGMVISREAKNHVNQELRKMELKPINVVMKKKTSKKLNEVVKRHNLIRDAFVNRLILLLLCPIEIPVLLQIPEFIGDPRLRELPSPPVGLMRSIKQQLDDPFYYMREAPAIDERDPLYLAYLHPKLIGFSCFLSDAYVPGTADHDKSNREFRHLISSLFKEPKSGKEKRSRK